ncbi:uncharacterized protein LOC129905569 [Episyrphus balteatus]|uniref:uncharacterized protein LOC129905569 n=1 Tax=Episyrphus balteatus TaxID=286459 RepID=UPI002484E901|nr:uncharacterized protein LOC129905569 [Episyrphus balteatus]
MRSTLVVLLLSAVAISAAVQSDYQPSPRYHPHLGLRPLPSNVKISQSKDIRSVPEFDDVVSYIEENVSPNDIQEMLDILPEALSAINDEELSSADDDQLVAQPRSVGSAIENVFEHIPWGKITDGLKKLAKNNPKMTKVLNLVSDPKFRDLVKKAVNSHTLKEFIKDVAEHGFSWTSFSSLMIHGLCSAATTIQHDKYSVGVCQVLQNV